MNTLLQKIRIYGLRKTVLTALQMSYNLVSFRLIQGSYSQHGEDLVIDKLLQHKQKGIYVDVGAYDPIRLSNTYRFYKRGWRGINIEPNALNFKKFLSVRKRDTNLNCGVGTVEKDMLFYMLENDALATFSQKEADHYIECGYSITGKERVPVRKLATIFNKYLKGEQIDFMSIDTQGKDMEVLRSNDWKKYRPRVICIETFRSPDHPTPESDMIHRFLAEKGYKKHGDVRLNSFFTISQ